MAKKQLCKDKLLEKLLFLKGGQKMRNQDLGHQGGKKQLSKDKLFKKLLFLKGGQKIGNQDLEPPGG